MVCIEAWSLGGFGELDNWLFISRFNDSMMLYSLPKLLTISVSKMLLEDLGISSTFPRWLFKHWWEKIVYKCYCNNHVAIFALLCFSWEHLLRVLSQIIIMLNIHIFIFIEAYFLQDVFWNPSLRERWWWLKYYQSFHQDNIANMYVYNRFSHPACLEISLYFIYNIINQHRVSALSAC